MQKNNLRRQFLKKVWATPILMSLGGLATSASAKGKDGKGKGKS